MKVNGVFCEICDANFKDIEHLYKHIYQGHKNYSCKQCKSIFGSVKARQNHIN